MNQPDTEVGWQMPRLLIVDDHVDVSEMLGMHLSELGYVVTLVTDAKAALRALMDEQFDGIISDVLLPGTSGLELAKAASARRSPVLLISGEPNSIERLTENSRYPFLQKPFHLDDLESTLSAMLNARVRTTT